MTVGKLNLNLLVSLDVLLRERSVSIAAERLHVTQSAVSGTLSKLRDYFDDELLVRQGHHMVLTPKAESIREPIHQALMQIRQAVEVQPEFDPGKAQRSFSIMCSDYIASVLIAPLVQQLAVQAPGVGLEIIPMSDHPDSELQRGDVDILIGLDKVRVPGHPCEPLFDETESCVAWKNNPLIADGITLELFQQMGHVAVRFGTERQPTIEQLLLREAGNIQRRIEIVVPTFSMVPQMLVGTQRIATLHTRLANTMAKSLPLVVMPMPIEIPSIHQVVQWNRLSSSDPGIMWLQQTLRHVAAEVV